MMCILDMYLIFLFLWISLVCGNETVTDKTIYGYWTPWYDEDTPRSGIGDEETIYSLEKRGLIICDTQFSPYSAECRTHVYDEWLIFNENEANVAPDQLATPCTSKGIVCRNSDQPMEETCRDYQVRFYCVKIGKDIIKEDNSSMIALAAGLTFLFPIVVALIINVCKRHCCVKEQTRQGPPYPLRRSTSSLDADQQVLFDPPPSYNFLFGHMTTSSENLISNASTSNETLNCQSDIQINIHTLSRSNVLPVDSLTLSETDNHYRQFRDRVKRYPGMHLSVVDMYHQYYDSNTTPPPSYNDALVILASIPSEIKKTDNTQDDRNS